MTHEKLNKPLISSTTLFFITLNLFLQAFTTKMKCAISDNWRHCLFNKYVPTLYNGDLFYVDSFPHQEKGTIVFCFYNCSDLLRENLFEQWNVSTIFETKNRNFSRVFLLRQLWIVKYGLSIITSKVGQIISVMKT